MVPNIIRVVPYGATADSAPIGPAGGGGLVEIYGGGFRLPPPPTAFPAIYRPTARVLFGGAAAETAVIRSNLIRAVAPPSPRTYDPTPTEDGTRRGFQGWVDVTVENLDDAGDPIPGESVTVSQGYAYVLPRLSGSSSVVARYHDGVVNALRRGVTSNVLSHQSVEYDSQTGDMLGIVDAAELPALVLMGPRIVNDRLYSTHGDRVVDPALVSGLPAEVRYLVARQPFAVSLTYDVLGMADSQGVLLDLMSAATAFVNRTPRVEIDRDPADVAKGLAAAELGFASASSVFGVEDGGSNDSDIRSFRGAITLRNVQVEDVEIQGDAGAGAVPEILTVKLQVTRL